MDKKLVGLVTLFFLSFLFFISVVLFNKPLSNLIRAKEDISPSSQNSLMFAWPIEVQADGKTSVKIDVFVRSESNKLVPNKQVSVRSTLGQVQPSSGITDKNGKTSFTLASDQPGTAELTAIIDNTTELSKKLTIKFD